MSTSEARIVANRANALKSTGPKTEEGKARSRGNALKHGLTGLGVVILDEDGAEVERRARAFTEEMKPSGESGRLLVRRMALHAIRMERAAAHENAAVAENVRKALEAFEAPEGSSPEEADRLRTQAGHLALFDPSREATLARKYEAAAERGYYRALGELEATRSKSAPARPGASASEARRTADSLGSILNALPPARPMPANPAPTPDPAPSKVVPAPSKVISAPRNLGSAGHFDLPIAIGRAG